MAKTKAKAKVKTVVKSKTKETPKKAVAKKIVPAKKKPVVVKKAASKANVPSPKGPIKKAATQKMQNAPKSKNANLKKASPAPKKEVKLVVASKPVAGKNKPTIAVSSKPGKKEKEVTLKPKKPVPLSKEVGGRSIKMDFPKKRAGRKPKNKGDEDDGFELLEVPKLEPINKKAPKKKFIIPVNPEVYVNPLAKPVPVPKNMGTYKKFEIEFPIHASPYIIYSFISSPAGLSEWFAENVNVRNDEYTFLWDGSQQTATLLSKKENTFMKFRWNDEPDFTFFEFRIVVDEITQDVAFWVTDFAEDEKSKEASEMLWHSQVDALIHAMGA